MKRTFEFRRATPRRAASSGFTLVEVLVVVVIIAVLATMIVSQYFGRVGDAQHAVGKQRLAQIEQAISMFYLDYERMPVDLGELVTRPTDIEPEQWKPPTLRARDLLDPWGQPYIYRYPGMHGQFDLYSLGKDGQEGGQGENAPITNWD